jgi:alpha-ketoglutarate-dependent 2,4-dichlorophenoxyacetate dioxygenase
MDFSARVHDFPTTYQNTWPYQKDRPEASLEPLQEGRLTVRPILNSGSSVFGAEVSGIDWSKAVPEDIVHQVSDVTIVV